MNNRISQIIEQLEAQLFELESARIVELDTIKQAQLSSLIVSVKQKIDDLIYKNKKKSNRINQLIEQLEAQLFEFEAAHTIELVPVKRAQLSSFIVSVKQKINGFKKRKDEDFSVLEKDILTTSEENEAVLEKEFIPKHFFKIDLEKYKKILLKMKEAKSSKEKGTSLEEITAYLFNSCGKLFKVMARNMRTRTAEIDIVISASTFMSHWGQYILVECKHWNKPAGVPIIRDIITNLQDNKCKVGILFSKEGITGDDYNEAKGLIREHYLLSDLIILVFDKDDLEKIANGKNFLDLLEKKYRDLKFNIKKSKE